MKRLGLFLLGLTAACGSGDDTLAPGPDAQGSLVDASIDAPSSEAQASSELDAASDADASPREAEASSPADAELADAGDASDAGSGACAEAGVPPSTLECAGLYSDFASKTVAPNAQSYAPAVPLWSDGATKERWIELPPGQTIDATNPNEWVFPIGTKLFKQFTYEGKRVETRMFQKTATNFWVHATYAWNPDETATTISFGATVPVDSDGGTWVIPTPDDCDLCHRGRLDRILGFEQVSLGLDGATGLTLLQLVVQGLVSPAPTQVNLRIGDDGTGLDAPALSWLHINCGVTCHNVNEGSDGYGAKMFLRLDPSLLDGSPVNSTWDPLQTTINVPCVSGSIQGLPRIVPGNPAASVIVQLTSERGVLQMPPIASRVVDTADVATVVAWIQHMSTADAGASNGADAGASGGADAGSDSESTSDAESSVDATVSGDDASSGSESGTEESGAETGSPADDAGLE
jgi:hypothetical protein